MHPETEPVAAVVEQLKAKFGPPPRVAMVLGSGLGVLESRLEVEAQCPTADLGLPRSTVPGHAGRMMVGRLGSERVLFLSGRVHLYEGYPAATIVRYVRALHAWGVERLLLTCSAGGISEGMEPGTLVRLTDHINLQHENPLVGPPWGDLRFPDMTHPYDPSMGEALEAAAREVGVELARGVYVAVTGPAYETPAEIRFFGSVGADLVGMSTVPEILAARQVGLRAAALAVVSNRAAGLASSPLSHDEVTETANQVGRQLADLLEVAVASL